MQNQCLQSISAFGAHEDYASDLRALGLFYTKNFVSTFVLL